MTSAPMDPKLFARGPNCPSDLTVECDDGGLSFRVDLAGVQIRRWSTTEMRPETWARDPFNLAGWLVYEEPPARPEARPLDVPEFVNAAAEDEALYIDENHREWIDAEFAWKVLAAPEPEPAVAATPEADEPNEAEQVRARAHAEFAGSFQTMPDPYREAARLKAERATPEAAVDVEAWITDVVSAMGAGPLSAEAWKHILRRRVPALVTLTPEAPSPIVYVRVKDGVFTTGLLPWVTSIDHPKGVETELVFGPAFAVVPVDRSESEDER